MSEIASLANEIGQPMPWIADPVTFRAEWAKSLARIVSKLGAWEHRCQYPAKIAEWCALIEATEPAGIFDMLTYVREEISAIDYDDGWALDPAGAALESVCLSLLPNTRWMAHAGNHVWKFATCSTAYNDVTAVSMRAWLRHVFDGCLAALATPADPA